MLFRPPKSCGKYTPMNSRLNGLNYLYIIAHNSLDPNLPGRRIKHKIMYHISLYS